MTGLLIAEQLVNGLQLGVLLFLLSAGLTLVFGVMRLVNLAHGSFYMLGAYFAVTFTAWTGSFLAGAALAVVATAATGIAVERIVLARLYRRDPLDQLLATFGLVLFFNELVQVVWGPAALTLPPPDILAGHVTVLPDLALPAWRLAIVATGLAVAAGLYAVVAHTRAGMWVRAGATNPGMASTLGINLKLLFTAVFAAGAALAALAGILAAPLLTVHAGMGDDILVLTFVVVVIGGMGSVRGAFVASLALGLIDAAGRAYLPELLAALLPRAAADVASPALSSVVLYVAMAVMLAARPGGLFPAARA
jgi:branched-chain amino acid transport system permease protein